jgi:signal transduction histidine kinase
MDKRNSDHPGKPKQKKQLQNITRLIDENQEIEMKYKQVTSELNLLKDRMQNLNHDLRSPLGGITGMLDLMIIKDKELLEVQTRELIMIRESAQSLLDLVNSTSLSRGTQKSLNSSKNFDRKLSSVLMVVNRLYLPMAQNKGISLSLRTLIDQEILLSYNFFVNLIQVIGNLVANAIKFTTSNGSVDVYSTLGAEDNHSIFYVTVTDTGKGMSADQVSAFNRGKPVSRSMGTNREEGYGIGLQHVQQMVSEDAGQIVVKSKKGSGTTFSLTFPLSDLNFIGENSDLSTATNSILPVNGYKS